MKSCTLAYKTERWTGGVRGWMQKSTMDLWAMGRVGGDGSGLKDNPDSDIPLALPRA
jgi:hypothetical protein